MLIFIVEKIRYSTVIRTAVRREKVEFFSFVAVFYFEWIVITGTSSCNEQQLATSFRVFGVIESLGYDIDLPTVTSVTRYMFVRDKVMFVTGWVESA
jgi:hypothetical protein